MAQWRVSFVFVPSIGNADTGGALGAWTENWYWAIDANGEGIAAAALSWISARRSVLTTGWRIQRFRCADWLATRTAFSRNVLPADGQGTYPTIGGQGAGSRDEQPYDVLIINSICQSGKGKNWALGGIGSDVVNAGGVFTGSANWQARFPVVPGGFANALEQGWAVKRLVATEHWPVSTASIIPGVGGTPNPFNPSITYTGTAESPPLGAMVRISGVQGMGGLNGTWEVQSSTVVGTTVTVLLRAKRGGLVVGAYTGGGSVWWYNPFLDRILGTATTTPHRGSSRKRGGNPDRPRGRRSRRRL